ncbi:MAG: hypothetical protein LBK75_06410 [Oscillospiraceae bacterium]|nr:hypothetical protein [Oscillospiraceae bacterium]
MGQLGKHVAGKMTFAKTATDLMLTEDEFHAELEKGYADIEKGNVHPAGEALAALRGELGV